MGSRGWRGLGLASDPRQNSLLADAFPSAEGSADAFSEIADASGADPGMSSLSLSSWDSSRETRQTASADTMPQPPDGDDDTV